MSALQISAVYVDHSAPWRVMYHLRTPVLPAGADEVYGAGAEEDGWKVVRWRVVGWAALGQTLWPVRLAAVTGRGVLCGSDSDPLRGDFLGVLPAGQGPEGFGEEVDALIQARHHGAKLDFWHAAA